MNVPSRELTPEDIELIEFARETVDANTDGEDGIHTMGAAVRSADGRMYGGINVYHFTGGPCAELVALGHARASGARELTTIVAVGNCGRARSGPAGATARSSSTTTPGSASSCRPPKASGASRSGTSCRSAPSGAPKTEPRPLTRPSSRTPRTVSLPGWPAGRCAAPCCRKPLPRPTQAAAPQANRQTSAARSPAPQG
jgi:hypothetical protein